MADRVEMTSPASSGTVLVPEALVGRFKAQGWASVEPLQKAKQEEPGTPKRGPGRPKKKSEEDE